MADPYLDKVFAMANDAQKKLMAEAPKYQLYGGTRSYGKNALMFEHALAAVKKPGDRAVIVRGDGTEHVIRNVTPEEDSKP